MRVRLLAGILAVTVAAAVAGIMNSNTGKAEQAALESAVLTVSQGSQVGGTARVAQSGGLQLDFNPETAEVTVTDISTSTKWSSNPVDRANDKVAKGIKKMDLNAQLLVDYVDPLNKPFQLNNYIGSIKEKAFTWKQIQDGIEITFDFPKAGFSIPVQYALKKDAFTATIVSDRIQQRDKYRLVAINLLPFFGAGSTKDDGYLFVPDGSGALIQFNSSNSVYKSYNERVYGGDQAIDVSEQSRVKEDIRLPVFGLKRNDHAFLAVINQGAYQAGISAEGSGKSNQYNAVSSTFTMTEFETNTLMAGSLNEKQVVRGSQSIAGKQSFEVRYYFLNGQQADYSGMAVRYRDYLINDQGVKPVTAKQQATIPLMIDFLGGVQKRTTFLGIPYRSVEVLTSFKDLTAITQQLFESGMNNLAIRYEGWASGGMNGKVLTSLDADSKLGGNKAFRRLIQEMDRRGVAFYPVVDPVKFYKGGNGFYKFFDVTKSISRAPAVKNQYLLSNGTKDKTLSPWYLLKPESVNEALDRFSAAAKDKGLKHAALESIGSLVYSDFRRSMLSKDGTGQLWESGLDTAVSRIGGLSFDHPNAYTFIRAESLTDVPLASSGFDVEEESVPFYSIALSGLIPAFGEPINLVSDSKPYMLKLIETGTYPAYRFIARSGSLLAGSQFDSLYSGDFQAWFSDVKKQYNEINKALLPIAGQPIMHHEKLGEGVYRTTFANGKAVLVNYTNEPIKKDQQVIPPGGYVIQVGGGTP
ncbi:hypothetical protein Back11_55490 [Paenibacillus baekrokdamisoli]|uniref:Uncharacterized protein n=1 Tax=Paenibacillus baekrokdamisoli TaxID=1712516 RepID=A0A3G9JMW8_9BACL|nr:DUF5696 domain-containing protein [Paenibacillus baekrokdamisoli]MBB3071814.1 hypothetical protein [Paenibacillus baekrokdamisoli]BBH24204.1 hypothetical protein Back11_55490 [Paenibacillus baekrokdamisoli]